MGCWSSDRVIAGSWRFARIRSLRNLRQKIQNPEVSVNSDYEFPRANGTLRLLGLPRPSSTAEDHIERADDVEIEEGERKGSRTEDSWSRWREFLSTSWRTTFVAFRPRRWNIPDPNEKLPRDETNSDEYQQCLATSMTDGPKRRVSIFWGVGWDYKIPDPLDKASWRIQVGRDLQRSKILPDQTWLFKKQNFQKLHNWPMTELTPRWLLMFVWRRKRILLLLCRALWGKRVEGKLRPVQLWLLPVKNNQKSENTGSRRKSEAKTYGPQCRKKKKSFHNGMVHKPVSVREAVKIPESATAVHPAVSLLRSIYQVFCGQQSRLGFPVALRILLRFSRWSCSFVQVDLVRLSVNEQLCLFADKRNLSQTCVSKSSALVKLRTLLKKKNRERNKKQDWSCSSFSSLIWGFSRSFELVPAIVTIAPLPSLSVNEQLFSFCWQKKLEPRVRQKVKLFYCRHLWSSPVGLGFSTRLAQAADSLSGERILTLWVTLLISFKKQCQWRRRTQSSIHGATRFSFTDGNSKILGHYLKASR